MQLGEVVLFVDADRSTTRKLVDGRVERVAAPLHEVGDDEKASPIEAVRTMHRHQRVGITLEIIR